MTTTLIMILVLIVLIALLAIRLPIYAALGVTSAFGILLLQGVDGLGAVPSVFFDRMSGFTLVAAPLFILMGEIIFRSGMGSDIYTLASKWLSGLKGSLGMASVAACAIFGALCGVSVAGAATIGKFAIPEMLSRGYDRRLATGCVAAAGSLALLIPPSVGLILYGTVAEVSVGLLFIAGVIPGILLAFLMMAYVFLVAHFDPQSVGQEELETVSWAERWQALWHVLPSLLLIVVVLGVIYTGVATPTEAAAIGCIGALLVAALRGRMSFRAMNRMLRDSMLNSGMILIILANALLFGYLLTRLRIPQELAMFLTSWDMAEWVILLGIIGLLVVMGMFLDSVSVILIATPLLLPAIKSMGYDPIWFGIILAITCEIGVITPPIGLNLFVIKGIASDDVTLSDVVRGAAPFIGVLGFGLFLLILFPGLVLWLPFL